jgi:hypothetical protein
LDKSRKTRLIFRIGSGKNKKDTDTTRFLLRFHRERPNRRRAAKKGNELASPHCRPEWLRRSIVAAKTSALEGATMSALVISGHVQCKTPCPLYTQ